MCLKRDKIQGKVEFFPRSRTWRGSWVWDDLRGWRSFQRIKELRENILRWGREEKEIISRVKREANMTHERQTTPCTTGAHILISRACDCIRFRSKGTVRVLLTFQIGKASWVMRVLMDHKRESEKELTREARLGRCNCRFWRWRKEATSQAMWTASKNWRREETDSPCQPPEGSKQANTLILAQWGLLGFLISRTYKIN